MSDHEDQQAAKESVDQERADAAGISASVVETQRREGAVSLEEERRAGTGDERFQQLLDKRHESGLNDAEADELGRMMAEREGKPYSNPRSRVTDEDTTG